MRHNPFCSHKANSGTLKPTPNCRYCITIIDHTPIAQLARLLHLCTNSNKLPSIPQPLQVLLLLRQSTVISTSSLLWWSDFLSFLHKFLSLSLNKIIFLSSLWRLLDSLARICCFRIFHNLNHYFWVYFTFIYVPLFIDNDTPPSETSFLFYQHVSIYIFICLPFRFFLLLCFRVTHLLKPSSDWECVSFLFAYLTPFSRLTSLKCYVSTHNSSILFVAFT